MSINKVLISGNLTREPELRQTASGMPVLSFGVAVNDRRKNPQTGEWEDYPNFVDCTMFGNRANSLSRYLYKGIKVAIEGRLRYSSWEKDGQKRSKLEVLVDELEFMSNRNNNGAQGGSNGGYGNNSYNQSSSYGQSSDYGQTNGYGSSNNYGQSAGYGASSAAPEINAASSAYEDIPF